MKKPHHQWIEILYGPFFKAIGFFYRSYKSNRNRVKNLKTKEGVSSFITATTVIFLLVWILIFLFSSEESRNRLTEEVKQSFSELKSSTTK